MAAVDHDFDNSAQSTPFPDEFAQTSVDPDILCDDTDVLNLDEVSESPVVTERGPNNVEYEGDPDSGRVGTDTRQSDKEVIYQLYIKQ